MKTAFYLWIAFMTITLRVAAQKVDTNDIVTFNRKVADIETRNINQTMISVKPVLDYSLIRHLPLTTDTFAIYAITLNEEQDLYNRFLDGEISSENYWKSVQRYDIDTTPLTKKFEGKNLVYIYVGLDRRNKIKYVAVDCNNNNDLSDDKLYTFSLANYKSNFEVRDSLRPRLQIQTDFYNGIRNIPITIDLVLDPFDSWHSRGYYTSENEYYLNVILLTNHYMEGTMTINEKQVTIYEHKTGLNAAFSTNLNRHSRFRFFTKDSNYPNAYAIGDTVAIAGREMYLRKVQDKQLYLQQLSSYSDSSHVGAHVPALYANSLQDSRKVYLNELMKDKYVFIDFWGSWCRPCIASLPKLVQLHQKIKDRQDVMMIGIALENEEDVVSVQHLICENNLTWLNVWCNKSNWKSTSSLHSKLRVNQYPTYLIIDNLGKIVYNTAFDSCTREEAIGFFLDLIK